VKKTKSKLKIILFSILCVCTFIPYLLAAFGPYRLQKPSAGSTMGVIVGPIIIPDLDGGISDGNYSSDYSNANLRADTPYPNGALRSYKTLGIYNSRRDAKDGTFKYMSFARYFRVVRDDGRPIYDDDGILDVSDSVSKLKDNDEAVDYKAHITVTCTTLPSDNGGFLWTTRQARFKDAKFEVNQWSAYKNFPDLASLKRTMNINIPTNPSNQVLSSGSIYVDADNTPENCVYATINFNGECYWENTFWGGKGDEFIMTCNNIGGWINMKSRDWSNSLSSNAKSSTYMGKVAYYSPKSFTVVAQNLNNYVKINDVIATPKYGTSVVPFKDGHHIDITENKTKVDIENGGDGVYTTYYCFIDDQVPDVSYTYHNSNALSNRRVMGLTTDTSGAKTQTIYEGIFKDQVQVNFSYNPDTEAPETATYTYNGQTKEITSGTWLSEEGDYVITIKDLAGNTTISKFTIDKTAPSYNLDRLKNDNTYKITRWYLATIPNGYNGAGTYSYSTYQQALTMAKNAEYATYATSYTLTDINDFPYTNLVANGDNVKVGDYWYYKSKENPELYVYYFDAKLLDEVVEFYSKSFVSEETYKINTIFTPNNYGNKIDKSVIDNLINEGYIVNNFSFRFSNNNDTYKIYYDYIEDGNENWVEFQYNVPFISQVSSHGLYAIKEIDFVGHETTYLVYLDKNAPLLDIEYKVYGKDKIINQTISVADIPQNGELIYYYENFAIKNIIEDDNWWILEVKCPDGKTRRYTHLDALPDFNALGSGEYKISIADRSNNIFTFTVVLLGKAPEVKFEQINANTQLKITIKIGESYNQLRDIKIYRNGVCLNSENGYDEFPNDDTNELIYINVGTLKYTFNKGGIYVVEITDSFGRILSYDYKFEKDLPTGILVGVVHNGKTKDDVKFIYDNNKYFVVVTKDDNNNEPTLSTENKITTLFFVPEEESEIFYSIKLVDKLDAENYNIYSFTIKTIKPIIYLYGVEPNGKTGGNVYATWNSGEEQYFATYSLNGKTYEYRKGQNLTAEGSYKITLKDEIGNEAKAEFEIDKTIDFIIADVNGNIYSIEDIRYINFDIRIINSEPLDITLSKNNTIIDYEFGLMITDEGEYTVRLNDEYNNSIYFTFVIDKTPPTATLYGVENFGKTNKSAWIVSSETGLTCWFVRDDNYKDAYKLGQEIIVNGKYKVYIADRAKNYISFEFEIDKIIDYDINVYRGGISNVGVRIVAYEYLKIVMYKDGNPFEYSFEQVLNDEGEYSYTLIDELGNRTSSFFNIITKKKQNLNHILQEDIKVLEVKKDDENYEYQILENKLYLYDEGHYVVNIKDEKTDKIYSFEITLDTTPPTLELVGVENGGSTKNVVVMKNVSEKPYTIYVTVDGALFEYKIGDKIEKCGRFIVVLTDEAGNSTTYTFERVYSLNGPSIAVLAGLGALVILSIILLIKSRHHYYKDEIVEEEIEETIGEDDLDNGDEENPENKEKTD